MRRNRKLFAVLMSLLLVVTCMPSVAWAGGESGQANEPKQLYFIFSENEDHLTISEEGIATIDPENGWSAVTEIEDGWYSGLSGYLGYATQTANTYQLIPRDEIDFYNTDETASEFSAYFEWDYIDSYCFWIYGQEIGDYEITKKVEPSPLESFNPVSFKVVQQLVVVDSEMDGSWGSEDLTVDGFTVTDNGDVITRDYTYDSMGTSGILGFATLSSVEYETEGGIRTYTMQLVDPAKITAEFIEKNSESGTPVSTTNILQVDNSTYQVRMIPNPEAVEGSYVFTYSEAEAEVVMPCYATVQNKQKLYLFQELNAHPLYGDFVGQEGYTFTNDGKIVIDGNSQYWAAERMSAGEDNYFYIARQIVDETRPSKKVFQIINEGELTWRRVDQPEDMGTASPTSQVYMGDNAPLYCVKPSASGEYELKITVGEGAEAKEYTTRLWSDGIWEGFFSDPSLGMNHYLRDYDINHEINYDDLTAVAYEAETEIGRKLYFAKSKNGYQEQPALKLDPSRSFGASAAVYAGETNADYFIWEITIPKTIGLPSDDPTFPIEIEMWIDINENDIYEDEVDRSLHFGIYTFGNRRDSEKHFIASANLNDPLSVGGEPITQSQNGYYSYWFTPETDGYYVFDCSGDGWSAIEVYYASAEKKTLKRAGNRKTDELDDGTDRNYCTNNEGSLKMMAGQNYLISYELHMENEDGQRTFQPPKAVPTRSFFVNTEGSQYILYKEDSYYGNPAEGTPLSEEKVFHLAEGTVFSLAAEQRDDGTVMVGYQVGENRYINFNINSVWETKAIDYYTTDVAYDNLIDVNNQVTPIFQKPMVYLIRFDNEMGNQFLTFTEENGNIVNLGVEANNGWEARATHYWEMNLSEAFYVASPNADGTYTVMEPSLLRVCKDGVVKAQPAADTGAPYQVKFGYLPGGELKICAGTVNGENWTPDEDRVALTLYSDGNNEQSQIYCYNTIDGIGQDGLPATGNQGHEILFERGILNEDKTSSEFYLFVSKSEVEETGIYAYLLDMNDELVPESVMTLTRVIPEDYTGNYTIWKLVITENVTRESLLMMVRNDYGETMGENFEVYGSSYSWNEDLEEIIEKAPFYYMKGGKEMPVGSTFFYEDMDAETKSDDTEKYFYFRYEKQERDPEGEPKLDVYNYMHSSEDPETQEASRAFEALRSQIFRETPYKIEGNVYTWRIAVPREFEHLIQVEVGVYYRDDLGDPEIGEYGKDLNICGSGYHFDSDRNPETQLFVYNELTDNDTSWDNLVLNLSEASDSEENAFYVVDFLDRSDANLVAADIFVCFSGVSARKSVGTDCVNVTKLSQDKDGHPVYKVILNDYQGHDRLLICFELRDQAGNPLDSCNQLISFGMDISYETAAIDKIIKESDYFYYLINEKDPGTMVERGVTDGVRTLSYGDLGGQGSSNEVFSGGKLWLDVETKAGYRIVDVVNGASSGAPSSLPYKIYSTSYYRVFEKAHMDNNVKVPEREITDSQTIADIIGGHVSANGKPMGMSTLCIGGKTRDGQPVEPDAPRNDVMERCGARYRVELVDTVINYDITIPNRRAAASVRFVTEAVTAQGSTDAELRGSDKTLQVEKNATPAEKARLQSALHVYFGAGSELKDVFDLSLEDGGQPDSAVDVVVPLELGEGEQLSDYQVVWFSDEGMPTPMVTEEVDGGLVFKTGHFSTYAIAKKPNTTVNSTVTEVTGSVAGSLTDVPAGRWTNVRLYTGNTADGLIRADALQQIPALALAYQPQLIEKTDSREYLFAGIPDGTYKLAVSKQGYIAQVQTVTVSGGGQATAESVNAGEGWEEISQGDVNLDGYVSAADITALARYVAGIEKFPGEDFRRHCNFDGSGQEGKEADAKDLTRLAKFIAGISNTL